MNQEAIGKFIAVCRKEKGLTQQQLAEKLNITNRAVSKWEKKNKAQKMYMWIERIWGSIVILLVPVHLLINFYYPENQGTGVGPAILLIGLVLYAVYFLKFYKIEIKLK